MYWEYETSQPNLSLPSRHLYLHARIPVQTICISTSTVLSTPSVLVRQQCNLEGSVSSMLSGQSVLVCPQCNLDHLVCLQCYPDNLYQYVHSAIQTICIIYPHLYLDNLVLLQCHLPFCIGTSTVSFAPSVLVCRTSSTPFVLVRPNCHLDHLHQYEHTAIYTICISTSTLLCLKLFMISNINTR